MGYLDETGLAEFTTKMKTYIDNKFAPTPQEEYFLTFSSPNSFTLSVVDNQKYWDGTLETSTDKTNWTTWSGTSAVSSASDGTKHNIFVRGTGNTVITGSTASNTTCCWRLNGSDISIKGNIETLLDYATVVNGQHPAMASNCFRSLFRYPDESPNTSIVNVEDLELPTMTLTDYCYDNIFRNNANLVKSVRELPATTVPQYAYRSMFLYNTSLTTVPTIKSTTLTGSYNMAFMFQGCSSLTTLPNDWQLPATTLASYCYSNMFAQSGISSLPSNLLPATTLADHCYYYMFQGCSSLTTLPSNLLPATTLGNFCYCGMFYNCSNLETLPKLPATTMATACYQSMFDSCLSLGIYSWSQATWNEYRIPYTGTGTMVTNAFAGMFGHINANVVAVPTINTIYYTPNEVV